MATAVTEACAGREARPSDSHGRGVLFLRQARELTLGMCIYD